MCTRIGISSILMPARLMGKALLLCFKNAILTLTILRSLFRGRAVFRGDDGPPFLHEWSVQTSESGGEKESRGSKRLNRGQSGLLLARSLARSSPNPSLHGDGYFWKWNRTFLAPPPLLLSRRKRSSFAQEVLVQSSRRFISGITNE